MKKNLEEFKMKKVEVKKTRYGDEYPVYLANESFWEAYASKKQVLKNSGIFVHRTNVGWVVYDLSGTKRGEPKAIKSKVASKTAKKQPKLQDTDARISVLEKQMRDMSTLLTKISKHLGI